LFVSRQLVAAQRSLTRGTLEMRMESEETRESRLDVPSELVWFPDATLIGAARLLRALHDVTAEFTLQEGAAGADAAPVTPGSGLPQASVIPIDTVTGTYTYQLLDLSTTLWSLRNTTSLFGGPSIALSGGQSGLTHFVPAVDIGDYANPLWQWGQNAGSCAENYEVWSCWYGFAVDGTGGYDTPAHWPATAPEQFLTDPQTYAAARFTNLPELYNPSRYNPFITSPPNYYGYQPFSGYIVGAQTVSADPVPYTWTASPIFGVAPYTYLWSGAVSGTGSSVSGIVQNDYIYLDMWDAVGQHVAASIYVQSSGCSGSQIVC
jgi:hypothetical protein